MLTLGHFIVTRAALLLVLLILYRLERLRSCGLMGLLFFERVFKVSIILGITSARTSLCHSPISFPFSSFDLLLGVIQVVEYDSDLRRSRFVSCGLSRTVGPSGGVGALDRGTIEGC